MGLEQLNEYSASFAFALFAVHAEWREYGCLDQTHGCTPGALLVRVPSPIYDNNRDLWITTDNDEITVGFDQFHCHFTADGPNDFDEALEFIGGIVDEKILIAVSMRGGQWMGSTTLEPGEKPDVYEGQLVQVRSWKGTFDADYQA